MNLSELINEILSEWAYRVDDGMPNPKNPTHLKELNNVLNEMGLSHIKNTLIENLLMEKGKTPEPVKEEEGSFSNPILNKKIKYKNTKGEDKEGLVGNLLRLPAEHPGRKAAEALLPADGSPERDSLNKDLGGQGQAAKPEDGKGEKGGEAGGGEEDKAKAAQAMFDPKADPAMAARLDKEKEVQSQLAKDAEADKEVEKEQEPKEDNEFNPIDTKDVAKEMPQADPETFNGDSDIPDGVTPEQLEKFNTDIAKVAQQVADAKAKGEPAPNINLCDVTVPGTNLYCDDNLGIPRDEMPQFKGTAQPGSRAAGMEVDASGEVDTEPVFKEMLKEKGIKTLQTQIPADKLKATQKDLVGAKVVGMMGALEKDPQHPKITAPIYVSRDGHVIDGHHRWAAIVAYNAAHPDSPIPMKTTVLDMDIKDAIPMANKFAEDMGIAAKKADANKEDVPSEPTQREPANDDPESKAQQFKGKSSGENIQTMEMEGGGFVYGTKHGNTAMVDDILDDVKSKIPKERWKDVVFVGEGGATNNDTGEIEFNDEMKYAAPKFKEFGAGIDTWDGDDMDVHNSESKLYQKQKEKTGLNDNQILAGNWASMIGQGEGQGLDPNDPDNNMKAEDYLDDDGKQFLQDAAKEAGLPPIENFDNPTGEKPSEENGWKGTGDRGTLYRLSFPGDNGDKETKINDIQVAFNDARDEHLIEKNKELTAQGKIPITIAGESHVELVDKMTRKGKETSNEKLPEPEKPSEKDGGVVYSLGGGYYSDKPNGPAQYMASESVVEKVLIEGDINFSYLLFEGAVTKKTSKGNNVKLVTIDPKNQDKATAAASVANSQSADKNTPSAPQAVTSAPNITNKIKKKIENWSESEKDYFKKGHHKAGSEARRTIAQTLKDKAKGTWQAVKDGLKHEVHEFKTAGTAVGKLFSSPGGWNDLSHHEKDALKAVGVKIVTTALFGAAMGGLSHGTAGFAKHVAVEFVPHVIAETFLKGAGRAALFADTEGEAEMDAQFIKFTELLADGLENMKISPEQMDEMIDSYNKKKANGEEQPEITKEELKFVSNLMLEMINGFIDEAKPKANTEKFQAISKQSNKVVNFNSKEARDAAIEDGTHTDMDGSDKSAKPVAGAGMYDDEYQTQRGGAETPPPASKSSDSEENPEGLYDPNDTLQSAVVDAKNPKELFSALDELGKDEEDIMLDKVKAGAGGPVASTGETLCTEAQTNMIQGRYNPKEVRSSKEYKAELASVRNVMNGTDKRAKTALTKELDNICDKMGYYNEDGSPDYELAMAMKAEADLYIKQNLPAFKKTNVAKTKFKKEEDMVSWMKASFYSSYSLINNGPADWDRKKGNGRVMKANPRTQGAVKQVLMDGLKNAKTPEEKAHYENQLKVWNKFKGYHDTFMVYKNDKGLISVFHISNKKSDELDDPQNNTTPETRLANFMAAARERNLSPKAAKSVSDAQLRALQGSADNDNIAKSAYNEIPEEDVDLVASLANRLPARGQTDVKDEYYTDLKKDKAIQSWYKKKYGDKWEAKWKAAKPKEIIGVAMEIAKNTEDISKLSGNFTKFMVKQGQLAQSIFEKAQTMTPKQISDSFKGIYSEKEIKAILANETMKMLADRKAQHAAGLEGVHKGFITSLHKADGTKPGHNGKNGPAVETYVAGTLKSLHIDTYVTNFDESIEIEMGGVGCKPIDVRGCMASLSGFKGDTTTPEGRDALNKHLAETVKVDADSDAVYLLGSDGKTRTYLASDTWRQAGSSKKIATGFGSNLRKCLKKAVGSRLSKKKAKK